ncbi:nuclease-related domain-containing protein [Alteribacter aurantiacus]|uniref:nuclease-related domain-containing protein n=1 Tax=Alteribacter aurantiacus TaxID=254410 RepID=UPI0004292D55|nr:nuclease-related domain-containing protein [Alteribacter aurantiacus]
MIIKPRQPSLELLQLEALEPRFPLKHLNYLYFTKDIGMARSGYRGEESINYYLQTIARSKSDFLFHHLRLPAEGSYFQIDTLIVTPSYLLIIEIKNLGGSSLTFNGQTNQVKQTFPDGRVEMRDDPLLQARRQRRKLQLFLKNIHFPPVPIEYLAVLSNKNPEITFSPDYQEKDRVIRSTHLDFSVLELDAKYPNPILLPHEIHYLNEQLLHFHTELRVDIFKKYELTRKDIITGVRCSNCGTSIMKRRKRSWFCFTCHYASNHTSLIVDTLRDYSLLVSPKISHQEFRWFFNIESSQLASALLKRLNLPREGTGRGMRYLLSELVDREGWVGSTLHKS